MRGRLYGKLATTIVLSVTLVGCSQSTRHSNTMVFGTNTRLGVHAGSSSTSIPEVSIGYSRQEAVVLPLVANIADDGKTQKPCNLETPIGGSNSKKYAVHPCSFVAVRGEALDSYSVLASFGAKFDGTAKADGSSGKVGLAQYFATGMAAQLLSFSGGAAVVSVGDSATKAAEKAAPNEATLKALFGGASAFEVGGTIRDEYSEFQKQLVEKVKQTDKNNLASRITEFERAAGAASVSIADSCTTIDACARAIEDKDPYMPFYINKKDAFKAAFDAWAIP